MKFWSRKVVIFQWQFAEKSVLCPCRTYLDIHRYDTTQNGYIQWQFTEKLVLCPCRTYIGHTPCYDITRNGHGNHFLSWPIVSSSVCVVSNTRRIWTPGTDPKHVIFVSMYMTRHDVDEATQILVLVCFGVSMLCTIHVRHKITWIWHQLWGVRAF